MHEVMSMGKKEQLIINTEFENHLILQSPIIILFYEVYSSYYTSETSTK